MSFSADISSLVFNSVDLLHAIPSWWKRVSLSSVSDITTGYPFQSRYFSDTQGVPVIRIRDVTSGSTSTYYNGPIPDGYWIEPGDLLVGMDGDFNLRVWKGARALLNQRVCKVDVRKDSYDPAFLRLVLPAYLRLINENTHSTTVKHLSSRTLEALPVPFTSLREQRHVASRVNELFSGINRARHDLARATGLFERLAHAVLSKAFGDVEELPVRALGDMAALVTSGSRDWSKYYGKGASVFILAGNVKPMRFDPIPKQLVDAPQGSADAKRTEVRKNDILITIVGANTGDICSVDVDVKDYYVCQSVALVRLQRPAQSRFVELFLNSEFGRKQIDSSVYGQGRPHLGFDDIKALQVPDVDDETALRTVNQVDALLSSATNMAKDIRRSVALLEHLERSVLVKMLSGEMSSPSIAGGTDTAQCSHKLGPLASPRKHGKLAVK